MQSHEMNIVEMLVHFVWFATGFVPGYWVGQQNGLIPGLMVGFIAFLLLLFAAGRVRLAIYRKQEKAAKRP